MAKVEQPTPPPVKETSNGCSGYQDIVKQYDWDWRVMLAIMRAESGCVSNRNNAGLNADGSIDYGLLQINSIHGHSEANLYNPWYNIQAGYNIWKSQGYQAWSAYNNGAYKKFL